MSSRFPIVSVAFAAIAALSLTAANLPREDAGPPITDSAPRGVPATTLFPGGGSPPPQDPHAGAFRSDPAHIADGRRLFTWYNCSGCHFNGGGGIGPALMDDQWIYGNRIDQVFASIYQGRPNGMPSWGGKIPNAQIWEIAAYVLSLAPPNGPQGGTVPPPQ